MPKARRVARVHVAIDRIILEQVAELTAFAGYKTRRYQPGQFAGASALRGPGLRLHSTTITRYFLKASCWNDREGGRYTSSLLNRQDAAITATIPSTSSRATPTAPDRNPVKKQARIVITIQESGLITEIHCSTLGMLSNE